MKVLSKDEFEKINVLKSGEENTAFAKHFIGNPFLNPLTKPKDRLSLQMSLLNPVAAIAGAFTTRLRTSKDVPFFRCKKRFEPLNQSQNQRVAN